MRTAFFLIFPHNFLQCFSVTVLHYSFPLINIVVIMGVTVGMLQECRRCPVRLSLLILLYIHIYYILHVLFF